MDYYDLAHEFFDPTRTRELRNTPGGRMYYRGNVLYSYRDSFPIAVLRGNRAYILHREHSVSRTTTKHITCAIAGATKHERRVTFVDVDRIHEEVDNERVRQA